MKKPYRNALRSRAMIREAFISLLAEKPLEKITVVDIVERSDLSRNTFYAHYQDVYAVLEEYQQEALVALDAALQECMAESGFADPLPLFLQTAAFVEAHQDSYRVLMNTPASRQFISQVRRMIITCVCNHLNQAAVRDQQGLLLCIEVICAGYLELICQKLRHEQPISYEEISKEIYRMYLALLPLYQ